MAWGGRAIQATKEASPGQHAPRGLHPEEEAGLEGVSAAGKPVFAIFWARQSPPSHLRLKVCLFIHKQSLTFAEGALGHVLHGSFVLLAAGVWVRWGEGGGGRGAWSWAWLGHTHAPSPRHHLYQPLRSHSAPVSSPGAVPTIRRPKASGCPTQQVDDPWSPLPPPPSRSGWDLPARLGCADSPRPHPSLQRHDPSPPAPSWQVPSSQFSPNALA